MSYIDFTYRVRSSEEVTSELHQKMGIGSHDVALNRMGKLASSQFDRLFASEVLVPLIWAGITVIGALVLRCIYYLCSGKNFGDAMVATLSLPSQLDPRMLDGGMFVAADPIVLLGACLAIFMRLRRIPWLLLFDLLSGQVETVEDKANVEMRGMNDGTSSESRKGEWRGKTMGGRDGQGFQDWDDAQAMFRLRMKDHKLNAPEDVIKALEEGHRYQAFFTKLSQHLVAIEPVASNASSAKTS